MEIDPSGEDEDEVEMAADDSDDSDFIPEDHGNQRTYSNFIQEGLKMNLSKRQMTTLFNAMLIDFGITDPNEYVSSSKMFNQRVKFMKTLHQSHKERSSGFISIGFDGKRSDIKTEKNQIQKNVEKVVVTNVITKKYITHFLPENGQGVTLAAHLYDTTKEFGSVDTIQSVSADGCRTNTGQFQGAIRHFQLLLNKPLQILICQLHLIELVFCKLFVEIDGRLSGPQTYTGPIGAQICQKHPKWKENPMVQFQKINGQVPLVEDEYLNNHDVKTLYRLCHLVQNGPKDPSKDQISAFQSPLGTVTACRWVTCASNALQLFLRSDKPSRKLVLLTEIILNIYGPILFTIKKKWQC